MVTQWLLSVAENPTLVAGGSQKGISIPRALHEEVSGIVKEDPAIYSTVGDFATTAIRAEVLRYRERTRPSRS